MSTAEIKKLLGDRKLIIGADRVLKALRNNNMTKVFVSSNCPENTLSDIKHYAGLNDVKVEELGIPNDELGVVCKKPFSVSTLGILK